VDVVTPFELAVQRRSRYYRTIGLTVILAIAAAFGARQVVGSLPETWTVPVMAGVPGLVLVIGVVWAVVHYLRCPSCERFDPNLAYGHSRERICPRCGAALP
jgi:hypothetical protein